jgi:tRNA-splicing ligase RtcB
VKIWKPEGGAVIKAWVDGVEFEAAAQEQVHNIARMPFVYPHIAIMPDVHAGKGATVGSVIPTRGAIIPAAVGVDIGCGMMALKTGLKASDLPDNLGRLRAAIEQAVPHGRTDNGGANDRGAWGDAPARVKASAYSMCLNLRPLRDKHPKMMFRNGPGKIEQQLCTLGTGNHFIEVCLDEGKCPNRGFDRDNQPCGPCHCDSDPNVWVVLHSGSRGIGNKIGTYFIEKAKEDMRRYFINLPDADLAYLPEGSENFQDYVNAVEWAQTYAFHNRDLMMMQVGDVLEKEFPGKYSAPVAGESAINCHHNYIARENFRGQNVWVTRKGAVRARVGDLGIIPGSMGARSYIVEGLGNQEALNSCSHGAGRRMSRAEARRRYTVADHEAATEGIECRKDEDVIDETPAAYKDIDQVMEAQQDLVRIRHTLKQVLVVKG